MEPLQALDVATKYLSLLLPVLIGLLWALHGVNQKRFADFQTTIDSLLTNIVKQLDHQDRCLDHLRQEVSTHALAQSVEVRGFAEKSAVAADLTQLRLSMATEVSTWSSMTTRNMESLAILRAEIAEVRAIQQQSMRKISAILERD